MKTIIAGSRSINDWSTVAVAVEKSGFTVTEVVSGTAGGVDQLGESLAELHGIPVKKFPANWKDWTVTSAVIKTNKWGQKYNAKAGHDRNKKMAEYADALIAVWDGKSSGTRDMIDLMEQLGKPVYVHLVEGDAVS